MNAVDMTELRYLVPFYWRKDGEAPYDTLYGALLREPEWEEEKLAGRTEQDIYDYLLDELRYSDARTNIGNAWKHIPENREKQRLVWLRKDKKEIYAAVSEEGLFLFRNGTGFFWYSLSLNTKGMSAEELIQFQNMAKELNKRQNLKQLYKVSDKSRIFPIPEEAVADTPEALNGDAVKCRFGKKQVFVLKERLPELRPGVEKVLYYEIFKGKELQGKYCGCIKWNTGDWIASVLRKLPCEIRYFAERRNHLYEEGNGHPRLVPDKAVLFTYALLELEKKEELSRYTYYLSNGYSENYLHPEKYEETMYHPFENVYWYITKNGCGCCAGKNAKNAEFFRGNMKSKMTHDYFILYILMLHQSYSLLYYANAIEEKLPADESAYRLADGGKYEWMERIISELSAFFAKGAYASVSHIQHHNELYQYGLVQLNIPGEVQSISMGLNTLADMQRSKWQEKLAADEKREENSLTIGLAFLSLAAIFSAFTDMQEFIMSIDSIGTGLKSAKGIAVLILGIFIAGIAGYTLWKLLKAAAANRSGRKK